MPQFLEATVDNSIPSDLPISLPANNIPKQREKLAVLVSTGKSKEALGFQLISKRNAFQTKMWRDIYKLHEAHDLAQDHRNVDYNSSFDAR